MNEINKIIYAPQLTNKTYDNENFRFRINKTVRSS